MLIDTHCHLDFPEFDTDREACLGRAKENGIDYIINVGSSLEGSRKSVALAQKYEQVYATVGIHPHEADETIPDIEAKIKELAKNKKVVAIGEIGLDYFKHFSNPKNQPPLFQKLIQVAKETNLPLVIHTRDAQADTLKILKNAMPLRAVVHCFSGDEAFLKECLDLGFLISFTCNVTYKKAENLREVLKLVPLERLLLETDAPYLSPEGFRGKRNEPFQVRLLAEFAANLRKLEVGEISEATTRNARKFFGF